MRRRKPASKKSPSECLPSPKQPTNYVYLSGFILLPDEVLSMLPDIVLLDYDYQSGGKQWKLHKSQTLNVEFWSAEKVNALRVAQKLEAA